MLLTEKIQALLDSEGEHFEIARPEFGKPSEGWLTVCDQDDAWHIEYRREREATGSAMAADFLKATGELKAGPVFLTGAWAAGDVIYPANPLEAPKIYKTLRKHVEDAYAHNCG